MLEKFDAMTSGIAPTGMTISAGAGSTATVNDVPNATDKSVRLYDSSATAHIEVTKSFAAQTGRVTAKWSFMQDTAVDGHTMTLWSGGIPVIEMYTKAGKLVYRDGAGVEQIVQSISPLSWYHAANDLNPATFKADVYMAGSRKLTGVTFRNAVTSVDQMRFASTDALAGASLYINNLSVSQAAVTLNETFDDMGYNANPRYWTVTSGSNTAATVRQVPSATDQSVQLSDTNPADKVEMWRYFQAHTEAFTVAWSFQQTMLAE